MHKPRRIVILTGAGISAESGVPTFRGPDGLWEGHRVEDVATPEAFRRDPVLVQRFYDLRREAQQHINALSARYNLIAKQSGLSQRRDRMAVDGFKAIKVSA